MNERTRGGGRFQSALSQKDNKPIPPKHDEIVPVTVALDPKVSPAFCLQISFAHFMLLLRNSFVCVITAAAVVQAGLLMPWTLEPFF